MKRFDIAPRWRKLLRDLRAEKGRVMLMIAAITVSLVAIGAVLGAYAILTREIAANYLGTHPATATLEMKGDVDAEVLKRTRKHALVTKVEARDVILARARVGADWRPLLLFVVEDFSQLQLNTFSPESGAWPPAAGAIAVERTAVAMLEAGMGQSLTIKTPSGAPRTLTIGGVVHDPGLAPAWQERQGYAYITRATLAELGEEAALHELRIELRDDPALTGKPAELAAVESAAASIAAWLEQKGYPVHSIRVPPLRQHPHQKQMTTILFMMLTFSVMALLLSAILVATSLAAMLARQVREIGVMKTLGATRAQIAALYAILVAGLGLTAFLCALPLGMFGARAFAAEVAAMLNFTLTSSAIPHWVFVVQGLAGILAPLLLAWLPIGRASRITVRDAIDRHGAAADRMRFWMASLPPTMRALLRRPTRLALTLALLAAAGAMFMTALNLSSSWRRNLEKIDETRFYDIEVRFRAAQANALAEKLRQLPKVIHVEPWGFSPAAFARPGQIDIERTYPDRGHGSLVVLAPPPDTRLIRFPLKAGRWLHPDDRDSVVLNHAALAQAPLSRIGDRISLSLDGQPSLWTLVGIVEEIGASSIGAAGVAYVGDKNFARKTATPDQARLLRIATAARSPEERADIVRAIERLLDAEGAAIELAMPFSEMRTAIGDHISILIRALIALAAVMAIVGLF